MSKKKWVLACAAILLPYLFLGFFNYPSADDYAYAVPVLQKGFWQAQIDWYQQWSGRFVSTALLSVSPVVSHSLTAYKAIGILTFALYLVGLYVFLSALLSGVFAKKHFRGFFVLFVTVLLSEIPSITESFHWFSGVVNYTWAFLVFLGALGFYLKKRGLSLAAGTTPLNLEKGNGALTLVLSLASVLLAGFNETLVVIWLYLIFLAFVGLRWFTRKWDWSLIPPLVLGLLGFYFVYRAPGNAVRAAQFQGNHDLLFTLFRPLGLFVEIFFRYLKVPFVFFLLWITPEVAATRSQIAPALYTRRARWLSFAFFLSLVFLFLAPAHWAIGGAPPRRAMNILCFIYVGFTLWMYCQWVWAKPEWILKKHAALTRRLSQRVQASLLILSFFALSNHGVAWADLLFRARDYAKQQQERIETLSHAKPEEDVVLAPLRVRPETLFFSELDPDPTYWINVSMAQFFGVRSVRIHPLPQP